LLIRVPATMSAADVKDAVAELVEQGLAPLARRVRLTTLPEGTLVEMLHVGPHATETWTVNRLRLFAAEKRLRLRGPHHEIYLSDSRPVVSEPPRTIVRYAVR
jgi:hypothetical protein